MNHKIAAQQGSLTILQRNPREMEDTCEQYYDLCGWYQCGISRCAGTDGELYMCRNAITIKNYF